MIQRLVVIIVTILLFNTSVLSQNSIDDPILENIISLREQSKSSEFSLEERLSFALQAVKLAEETKVDSTILLSNRNLSLMYFNTEKYDSYIRVNHKNIKLGQKLNDTSALAVANLNIASYYKYDLQNDSAYYYYSKALKFYNKLNDTRKKGTILWNIADLQETEKDFLGSEENAVEAIKLLSSLKKDESILDDLWILNNLLGIISVKLKSYDKAEEYHEKALSISKQMKDGYLNNLYSTNNIAYVYRLQGDLDASIELYQEVLDKKDLYEDDPSFLSTTLANMAYSKSLKEDRSIDELEAMFERAYKISDSLDDPIAKLGVTTEFSNFYLNINEKENALKYANETYQLAKETSSNDIRLEALLILSKLNDDKIAREYLNEHIRLSDSLLNVERNVRNKFARIELETDELEEENEKISQQRLWLLIISGGLLATLFFLYIIITQRARNKELKFEQDQQKANEEIYNLMLSQQDKVDEARANEKKRISEELHDGVLGRLFGTRLSLDSLNFSEGKEAITNRATYIKELMTIENDIRKISHDLNTDFVSGSGFMDIVSELIEKQTKAYQLESSFDYTDDINWESVPNKTKINIYRIVQESLQNIYKHANANSVKISIQLKNNVICLLIIDDGDGFDVNKSKKGIGLKNINSRVSEVEGTAKFNSTLKEGTEVSITIPYKN